MKKQKEKPIVIELKNLKLIRPELTAERIPIGKAVPMQIKRIINIWTGEVIFNICGNKYEARIKKPRKGRHGPIKDYTYPKCGSK